MAITEMSDFTVLMTNRPPQILADSERVFWTGREASSLTSPGEKELSVDFECAVFFLWHTEAVKWVSAMLAAVRPNSLDWPSWLSRSPLRGWFLGRNDSEGTSRCEATTDLDCQAYHPQSGTQPAVRH